MIYNWLLINQMRWENDRVCEMGKWLRPINPVIICNGWNIASYESFQNEIQDMWKFESQVYFYQSFIQNG